MKGFFYPKSIVVIGVSNKENNMGRVIVENLIYKGFDGQVHAVGPRGGVVLGRPIHKNIKEIVFPLDMAVILAPAAVVPGIVRECGEVGIRRIVIESGGFSEFSIERKALEAELLTAAREFGIRFVGPNCIGVNNTENGLATSFGLTTIPFKKGKVSVVSQSGGVAGTYMDFFAHDAIHFNKVISIGNKLNVDESDLLEYLVKEDTGTGIICMYLESIKNGRRLMQIAGQSKKPIIVHKSGIGRAGAASAASHTAALSTDDKVVSAAFKQTGIIRVYSNAQMVDFVKIFQLPPMKGRNLAIVSRSGGHAVIAADTAEHFGFELPPFAPEELEKIRKHVRGGVINLRNPLDLGDLFDLSVYESIARMVLSNDSIHGMILAHGYSDVEREGSHRFMHVVKELSARYRKPVALCLMIDDREASFLKETLGFPFFKSPEDGAWALSASYRAYQFRQHHQTMMMPVAKAVDPLPARRIIDRAEKENRNPTQAECFDVLKLYGIPVPAHASAASAEEAAKAAGRIGLPVVLKIDVPSVIHKSDVGGVVLNLNSPEAVTDAFTEMRNQLGGSLPPNERFTVLVMAQAKPAGQEVILGVKQDPTFGPTLLFGMGGVLAELMEDISLRIAPVDRSEVEEMIREIKGYRVLAGVRGRKSKDIGCLADNLLKLSALAQDMASIKEIDLNPVMSYEEGCMALDARFILQDRSASD
ncbi:MAG: acetate--CoA ligase family protein [Desulfobacterales bacterium]|jgi:acetyltransferase|nr:acetate--CoA ligase family protein [Desulfobacterales bacterium]